MTIQEEKAMEAKAEEFFDACNAALVKDNDGLRLDPHDMCQFLEDAINEIWEGQNGEVYKVELKVVAGTGSMFVARL
jgi:hypothetical protein